MEQKTETSFGEIALPSVIDDFEVGDRVVWKNIRWSFGTVHRVEGGSLFVDLDMHVKDFGPLEITENGTGDHPTDSCISQWRVFPNIATLKTGDTLSTTMSMYTNDETGKTRLNFTVIEVVRGKRILLQDNLYTDYVITLEGDNFSRNLEDAIYDWDLEG